MILLDGKQIAQDVKNELKVETAALIDAGQRAPHIAAVLVGNDPASETYVASKEKQSKDIGFTSSLYRFESNMSAEELYKVIDFLNNDSEVDGFIVQLPLPKHIDENEVLMRISPKKDVDGFHPINIGLMSKSQAGFVPATPFGIMQLLERYKIETSGKNCVVLGRSNIVGTPMAMLMSRKAYPGDCTVTMCHSKTKNIEDFCRNADILIAAIGQPLFVKEDMVKEGAVVIDVGIHRLKDETIEKGYRIVGDVDFDNVAPKCSYITPVPGGVGSMTIAALLFNTMKAYKGNKK